MYKIETNTDGDSIIIKVTNKASGHHYIYTKNEIDYIADPVLKRYLIKRIHFIENGAYE